MLNPDGRECLYVNWIRVQNPLEKRIALQDEQFCEDKMLPCFLRLWEGCHLPCLVSLARHLFVSEVQVMMFSNQLFVLLWSGALLQRLKWCVVDMSLHRNWHSLHISGTIGIQVLRMSIPALSWWHLMASYSIKWLTGSVIHVQILRLWFWAYSFFFCSVRTYLGTTHCSRKNRIL